MYSRKRTRYLSFYDLSDQSVSELKFNYYFTFRNMGNSFILTLILFGSFHCFDIGDAREVRLANWHTGRVFIKDIWRMDTWWSPVCKG